MKQELMVKIKERLENPDMDKIIKRGSVKIEEYDQNEELWRTFKYLSNKYIIKVICVEKKTDEALERLYNEDPDVLFRYLGGGKKYPALPESDEVPPEIPSRLKQHRVYGPLLSNPINQRS